MTITRALLAIALELPALSLSQIQSPTPVLRQIAVAYAQTSVERSVSISPSNPVYPPFNALRYGCDPTGHVSSSGCLRSLGVVLHAQGGGTGVIPCGTYLATNVKYPYDGIFLQGDGADCVKIENSGINTPTMVWGDERNRYYGGGLSGITFAGAGGVAGTSGQTAFTFQKVGQFRIENVRIGNFPGSLYRGAYFTDDSQFRVDFLQVQSTTLDGITFSHCVDEYVTDSRSDANGGSGWMFDATQGAEFKGDTAYNNSGVGWLFRSTAPAVAANMNNKFASIVGDTSGSYNIQIDDCEDCYFIDAWGSTQQSATVNTFATGILIATVYSKGIVFTGGQALRNNAHGVQIYDSGNDAPSNIIFNGFQFGSTDTGSNGNGKAGVAAAFGLVVNGASDHIRVNGGMFAGNTTGPALFGGTGADITCSGNPIGFVCANQGTASVPIGMRSVTVTHGLGFTPTAANIQVTPTSSMVSLRIASYWVSNTTSTSFTLNTNAAPQGSAFSFAWRASFNGN
jgi:hypothetical protein